MEGASSTATEITNALSTITTAMSSQVNMATIGVVIAAVLAGSVGLYVGWFAIRKLINAIKGALKGRLSV